ncbi:MAG TPA: hypothetical protein VF933_03560 [Streptosporangiaceae bacterium]|jgi:hypothetical protein
MILAATTISHPTGLALGGAVCFGIVVGYITYRTLARTTDKAAITDLASVIGAIGGGVITTLYGPADGSLFAMYSIGLVVGMALYLLASLVLRGKQVTGQVLGTDEVREE